MRNCRRLCAEQDCKGQAALICLPRIQPPKGRPFPIPFIRAQPTPDRNQKQKPCGPRAQAVRRALRILSLSNAFPPLEMATQESLPRKNGDDCQKSQKGARGLEALLRFNRTRRQFENFQVFKLAKAGRFCRFFKSSKSPLVRRGGTIFASGNSIFQSKNHFLAIFVCVTQRREQKLVI